MRSEIAGAYQDVDDLILAQYRNDAVSSDHLLALEMLIALEERKSENDMVENRWRNEDEDEDAGRGVEEAEMNSRRGKSNVNRCG